MARYFRRLVCFLTIEEAMLCLAIVVVLLLSFSVTGEFHLGRAGRIGNFFALICSCSLLVVGLHDVYHADEELPTMTLAKQILWRSISVLRDWLPLYFALSLYSYLYGLVSLLNPVDCDDLLLAADRALFGETPAVLMQSWVSPWLTEVLSFCYLSMMVFPPALLLCVHWKCDRESFHRVTVGLMVICLLGYCGYVLVPAVGPQVYMQAKFNVPLTGGLLSKIGHDIIEQGRNPRDCFPSMHVAVPFLMLLYSWVYWRPFLFVGFPLFVGIFISTMYLRYHYIVDLFAGMILAVAVFYGGVYLQKWWLLKQSACRLREE